MAEAYGGEVLLDNSAWARAGEDFREPARSSSRCPGGSGQVVEADSHE